MKYLPSYCMAFALVCTAPAHALVYVDATGAGGAYTTINAALASLDTEIVIRNTGVYQESLLVTRSVTIRGEDPDNRPVIAVHQLPFQPALKGTGEDELDGIYLGGDGSSANNLNIVFRDLIVIPTVSGVPPADDLITGTANAGTVLSCVLDNVLVTANNGLNQPVTNDVWANPNFSGATRPANDGVFFSNAESGGGLNGTITLIFNNLTVIGAGRDGIVARTGGGSTIGTGVNVSYSSRYGILVADPASTFIVNGNRDNPGIITRQNGNVGIGCLAGNSIHLDHIVAVENGLNGLRADWNLVNTLNVNNSLFAANAGDGIWTQFAAGATKTWYIADSTFFNNTGAGVSMQVATSANSKLMATDCIFAGANSHAVSIVGAGLVDLVNCGIVTEAGSPVAVEGIAAPGSDLPTEINSLYDDPVFVNTSLAPFLPNSFDVTDAAYGTASSTAGPLNGWGDGPDSFVSDWSVY